MLSFILGAILGGVSGAFAMIMLVAGGEDDE